MEKKYQTLKDFYPYYLTEHADPTCRLFHYIGTTLVIGIALAMIFTGKLWLFLFLPLAGYSFAWMGHFIFEKNKPATFQYPGFSLASDFIMYYHFLTGQVDQKLEEAKKTIATPGA